MKEGFSNKVKGLMVTDWKMELQKEEDKAMQV